MYCTHLRQLQRAGQASCEFLQYVMMLGMLVQPVWGLLVNKAQLQHNPSGCAAAAAAAAPCGYAAGVGAAAGHQPVRSRQEQPRQGAV